MFKLGGGKMKQNLLCTLIDKSITFSAAESCTGGMISQMMTSLSGASAVYLGGVVSYANEVKENVLGVSRETLVAYGAVSEQTAREMAIGVAKITGSELAVSVTGIAGPTGGTPEKPVGTVCFGIYFRGQVKTVCRRFGEDRSRDEIRLAASEYAMELALEAVRS